MKKYLRDYVFLALMAGIIIAVDQFSKEYVRTHLAVGEMWAPWDWMLPYARIVHWTNTGVAFGLFQGRGQIFTVLAILVAIAIIYYFPRVPAGDWTLRIAMGLQLGGALGNLVDRVVQQHVTDFISIGTFPVFNVADSSITVGVGVLILGVLIQEQRERKAAREKAGAPPDEISADGQAGSEKLP